MLNLTLRSLWGHSSTVPPEALLLPPSLIRFGMLRNFFMPAKRPPLPVAFFAPPARRGS